MALNCLSIAGISSMLTQLIDNFSRRHRSVLQFQYAVGFEKSPIFLTRFFVFQSLVLDDATLAFARPDQLNQKSFLIIELRQPLIGFRNLALEILFACHERLIS